MLYDWHGNSLLILHNFAPTPQCIEIDPGVSQGGRLVNLQVEEESRADLQGRHRLALEPYGYRWYRFGSLKPALQRAHG